MQLVHWKCWKTFRNVTRETLTKCYFQLAQYVILGEF